MIKAGRSVHCRVVLGGTDPVGVDERIHVRMGWRRRDVEQLLASGLIKAGSMTLARPW
jgi:hypothetical protein